jgi:hypothetical protein
MKTVSKILRRALLALTLAGLLSAVAPASAHAWTGAVRGSFWFWNRNGNFCPSGNACTGAKYFQSHFNTWLPVSNEQVWVLNAFTNALLGVGSTDTNGNFCVYWNAQDIPTNIKVHFPAHQKDNRFWFHDTSGAGYLAASWNFAPNANSTCDSNPNDLGGLGVGSSTSPDPYFNAYWGAEVQWRSVHSLVGVLINNLLGVEIRGFANNIPSWLGNQPNSAAQGPTKRVQLDANAAFAPQARVMHEIGHVAEYVTHPWQVGFDYTWSPPGQPAGPVLWGYGGPEWASAGFEEAFATHYGNIALWFDNAVTPTSCFVSQGHCYNAAGTIPLAATDVEVSNSPPNTNNCDVSAGTPESRWPISIMRFLWDVFDNRDDGNDTYSANQGDFWKHLHNLAWYPEGTLVDQHEEPWNSTKTAVTERDGRGAMSYSNNYAVNVRSIDFLRVNNCSAF